MSGAQGDPIGEGDPPRNGFRVFYEPQAGSWQYDVRAAEGVQRFAVTSFARWQWLALRRARKQYARGRALVVQKAALDV